MFSILARLFGGGGARRLSASDFLAERTRTSPVLDVRTPAEFAGGHLFGALNVDVTAPDFTDRVEKLIDRGVLALDRPVYLYCRSGGRSGRAAKILARRGFTEATNVGGIGALVSAGAKTE